MFEPLSSYCYNNYKFRSPKGTTTACRSAVWPTKTKIIMQEPIYHRVLWSGDGLVWTVSAVWYYHNHQTHKQTSCLQTSKLRVDFLYKLMKGLCFTSSMITPVLGKAVLGFSLAEGRFLNISRPPLYHLTLYTCSPCVMITLMSRF